MMSLLDEGHQYSHIICWLPHGRGFTILDKKKFETEVMPKFFQDAKYTSFTRRLRRWNFRIQTHGHKRSSYFHPSFVKGREDLCREMKALPQVRKRRSASNLTASSSSLPSLPRQQELQDQRYFQTAGILTYADAAVAAASGNGERSMKGPLKKRISAITAHPNDSNAHVNDVHAVVSTNGSCDSASSVGDSEEISYPSGGAAYTKQGTASERGEISAMNGRSSLAMPPLAQPANGAGNRNLATMENVVNTTNPSVPMNPINTVFCYPSGGNKDPGSYASGSSLSPHLISSPQQSTNMMNGMPSGYCHQPRFVSQQQPHQVHLQQHPHHQQQMMQYSHNTVANYGAPSAPHLTTTSYSNNASMMPHFQRNNNIMSAPSPAVGSVPGMSSNMVYSMDLNPMSMGYHGMSHQHNARGATNMMMHHPSATTAHPASNGFVHSQNFHQHSNIMTANLYNNYNSVM